jgi:hypothetical protein
MKLDIKILVIKREVYENVSKEKLWAYLKLRCVSEQKKSTPNSIPQKYRNDISLHMTLT